MSPACAVVGRKIDAIAKCGGEEIRAGTDKGENRIDFQVTLDPTPVCTVIRRKKNVIFSRGNEIGPGDK